MSITYWIVLIAVLVAGWWMGCIRPTGLLGRNREEEEQDAKREAADRWIEKHPQNEDKASD